MKEFGNINDVAEYLSISVDEVKNLIRRGFLLRNRHFIKEGRTIIFFLPEIREKIQSLKDTQTKKVEKKPAFKNAIPMARGYVARI